LWRGKSRSWRKQRTSDNSDVTQDLNNSECGDPGDKVDTAEKMKSTPKSGTSVYNGTGNKVKRITNDNLGSRQEDGGNLFIHGQCFSHKRSVSSLRTLNCHEHVVVMLPYEVNSGSEFSAHLHVQWDIPASSTHGRARRATAQSLSAQFVEDRAFPSCCLLWIDKARAKDKEMFVEYLIDLLLGEYVT
jgi:hypothetical protein